MRDNWDDLRFVLAVAEEGSVSAAARRLGVNHATVLRRVAAYEESVGVALFDKTARGYTVPGPQRRIIEAAREVDRAVQAVGRMLQGARAPLAGEVRVTSTDTLCLFVLPAIIRHLHDGAPDLKIELICANARLDLSRTVADIAVRPAERLPSELVGEAAASMGFGLYRKAGQTEEAWLGLSGALSRSIPARWMQEHIDPGAVAASSDSFPVLSEMAAVGQGMAILPDILARNDPRLERVAGRIPEMKIPVWVASHADLADVPRISETRRTLARAIAGIADSFLYDHSAPAATG